MNGEKVSEEKVERILEAARLAPTSSGLQPFEIFVVTNQEVKNQLKEAASNQPQVGDASHVLVFAAWDTYTEDRINYMFAVSYTHLDVYKRQVSKTSLLNEIFKSKFLS